MEGKIFSEGLLSQNQGIDLQFQLTSVTVGCCKTEDSLTVLSPFWKNLAIRFLTNSILKFEASHFRIGRIFSSLIGGYYKHQWEARLQNGTATLSPTLKSERRADRHPPLILRFGLLACRYSGNRWLRRTACKDLVLNCMLVVCILEKNRCLISWFPQTQLFCSPWSFKHQQHFSALICLFEFGATVIGKLFLICFHLIQSETGGVAGGTISPTSKVNSGTVRRLHKVCLGQFWNIEATGHRTYWILLVRGLFKFSEQAWADEGFDER